MGVLFNNIPGNIRVPFFYAEFQPGGTPYQQNARLLLIGQKLAAGSATANQPVLVRDGSAGELFGVESMLTAMWNKARANAPIQEIWALPLADAGAGVAATGKIAVAAPSLTFPQVLTVYIAGRRIRIAVLTSDTRATIATALTAAINAESGLPVTAAVNGTNNYEVDLTARHKGTLGNDVIIEAGVVTEDGPLGADLLTVTAMANGAGDPTIASALANLGDDEFDWMVMPYTDATNIGAIGDLLNDVNGRWSWAKQIYGHCFATSTGSVGSLSTLGNSLNNQHLSIFPCRKFRSMPYEVGAALAAIAAQHLQDAPELSRPLQTLVLQGITGPRLISDRLTMSDRQTLYYDGISGYHVRRDGSVAIDRVTTTYQSNAWGDPDWTYLDVETMAQSMYGIRYIRTEVTSKHARQALADDNPGGLPQIVTPADIKNTVIHAYSKLVRDEGVFENIGAFVQSLVVERDATDANRVNVGMKLDHVNQLRIVAAAAVNYMQLSRQTALAA
ncbi:MAG: phage tail sheath subtilisin-like domain-containing protein [Hyphomicrobiaceae bacterium]